MTMLADCHVAPHPWRSSPATFPFLPSNWLIAVFDGIIGLLNQRVVAALNFRMSDHTPTESNGTTSLSQMPDPTRSSPRKHSLNRPMHPARSRALSDPVYRYCFWYWVTETRVALDVALADDLAGVPKLATDVNHVTRSHCSHLESIIRLLSCNNLLETQTNAVHFENCTVLMLTN